ncbi:hypothetical protein BCY89_27740 [Sphingobacterium siyangense]|uniref:YD repeat-containing protein n=1 Tax=Sphingobacterium siyangense TaxID=459529 RepID=A0A420FTV8_9SPHI|nr:hypothetical protein [Sphingobacterium siyangense]RKF36389.1 hypothetical protein BCY89_27740 [Sphingobacterium siyangense]
MSKSSSPKFSQQLKYQDCTNPQWNGNISQQLWGDDATLPNTSSYQYDRLNRLTSGSNGQTGTASIAEVIDYDDLGMGNIKTLKRDALPVNTYSYIGNKLMSLSGGLTGSYTYDANDNYLTIVINKESSKSNFAVLSGYDLPVKFVGYKNVDFYQPDQNDDFKKRYYINGDHLQHYLYFSIDIKEQYMSK